VYQSYYNLSGKPFRLSPDPSFFFPSRGHKRALAYLRYGLNQDEGFVVITGAPGTGKTTLAKILLHEMGEKDVVVAHLTTTQLEADDMLRMVTASFGLRYVDLDKAQLLKSLESFLMARSREQKRALLVIDEAQNLPTRSLEELRMLSNLQVGDKALVQTFLLGQAQFRALLDRPELEQLRQRIIANYHLSPLATDESKRYIESRLQQVGWDSDPTFAELAYEKIYEYTAGIPRRINMLCDRVLLYSCMEEIHEITSEVIEMVTKELDQEVSGIPVSAQSAQMSAPLARKTPPPSPAQSPVAGSPIPDKKPLEILEEATQAFDTESYNKYKKEKKDELKAKSDAKSKTLDEELTEQVVGNTVARPQQKLTSSSDEDTRQTTEIPERDLFRVIPGGKTHVEAPDSIEPQQPLAPAASAKPTPEDVIQRRILRLVLAFHRSPSRFPGLDNPNQPLPEGITELLELAIADDQVLTQVSPAAVMGISPAMLRAAVRFFVRRALFVVDGDDYRVLGLRPTSDQTEVEKHYDLLMRLLRQDKQRGTADSVARVGQAYENLSRIDQAKQYIGGETPQKPEKVPEKIQESVQEKVQEKEPETPVDETLNVKAAHRKKAHISTSAQSLSAAAPIPPAAPIAPAAPMPAAAISASEVANMPVDDTISVKLNKTGKLDIQKGPDFEIEEGEMSIDFDTLVQRANNVDSGPNNMFARKPNEIFSEASRFSRKSMRFAGQFAVLGFGAVVIILGLYIVQLEPSDTAQNEDVVVKKLALSERSSAAREIEKQSKIASAVSQDLSRLEKEKADLVSRRDALLLEATRSRRAAKARTEAAKAKQQSQQLATYADLDIHPKSTAEAPVVDNRASQSAVFADLPDSRSATNTSASSVGRQSSMARSSEPVPAAIRSDADLADPDLAQPEALASSSSQGQLAVVPVPIGLTSSASDAVPRSLREEELPVISESDVESFTNSDAQSAVGANTASGGAVAVVPGILTAAALAGQALPGQEDAQTSNSVPAAMQTTSVASATIVESELNDVVGKFVTSYESGDINAVMTVFSPDARTNTRKSTAGIRSDYADLFNSTSLRVMNIKSIRWDLEGDHARGVGSYEAKINPSGTTSSQVFLGDVTIQARKSMQQGVKITRFYFTNQRVTSAPRMPEAGRTIVAAPTPAPAPTPKVVVSVAPSIAELNTLVDKFVQSYDQGDIDGVMASFAKGARTNDQTTTAGIRKDHTDLFASTSVRQMTIDNINWKFDKNSANGVADFVVLIQGKNNPSIDTYKGTINLAAKKGPGGVLLTKMLHNLQ